MKKTTLALCLSLSCLVWASAQNIDSRAAGSASTQTSATAQHAARSIHIENGTRLAAELQNTIDVRKAKVGDEVVLKTTQAIKSEGSTVVGKGARLVGRVTEVAQRSSNSASRIGILFDRLEHGDLAVPITATISSLTNARASTRASNDDIFASDAGAGVSARSTTSASSSSSAGGLLGGVAGVVNSTTSAVGSTVNSTTDAVGRTATGVGSSLGGIQITQSSGTSVQGESVLSFQGGNVRVEKGTKFNLVLTESARAGTTRDQ
jgi:hypothetical protein